MNNSVSIVIPAFNETGAIGKTIAEIQSVLKSNCSEWEIIVVNDGSSDNTAEEASLAGARVVGHPHNIGYGRSLKTGILAANYDTVIITDADATYPPEDIPKLLRIYQKGFDMVVGARTGENYRQSHFKFTLRIFLKFLVEFTAGRKIPDINSGMRVFSKKTILPYFDNLCETFSFTTSLTLAYMMTSKFVVYETINYHPRVGQTKVRLLRDSLRTLQFIVEAILFYNPIKIFIVFSAALLIASMLFFGVTFIFQLNSTFYLGIGCILTSIIMFGLGLTSVLLSKILRRGA